MRNGNHLTAEARTVPDYGQRRHMYGVIAFLGELIAGSRAYASSQLSYLAKSNA